MRTFVRINFVCTNIFGHLGQICLCEYIRKFVREIVRVWKVVKYSNMIKYSYNFQYKYLFGHSFVSIFLYEYIRTFVRVIFLIRIYSDIRLSQSFHECHTLIQSKPMPSSLSFVFVFVLILAHLIVAPSSSLVARNLRVLVVSHVPCREPGCVALEYSGEKISQCIFIAISLYFFVFLLICFSL